MIRCREPLSEKTDRGSACQKSSYNLADREASSPVTATHYQFSLKSYGFPGAKTARKRFFLRKISHVAAVYAAPEGAP